MSIQPLPASTDDPTYSGWKAALIDEWVNFDPELLRLPDEDYPHASPTAVRTLATRILTAIDERPPIPTTAQERWEWHNYDNFITGGIRMILSPDHSAAAHLTAEQHSALLVALATR